MHLNGWRRLWIAVAGLWAVVVVAGALLTAPTARDVPNEDLLIERLSSEQQKFLKGFIPDDGPEIELQNGHVLEFKAGATQDQMSLVARAYSKVLRQAIFEAKRTFWLNALLIWAAPLALIYLIGEAVAWIRRGFGARAA